MAASTKHVLTNVWCMSANQELTALWQVESQARLEDGTERSIGQAWVAFVQAADAAKIADKIPGTVGRAFKAQYAAASDPEATTEPEFTEPGVTAASAPAKPATTARKSSVKK